MGDGSLMTRETRDVAGDIVTDVMTSGAQDVTGGIVTGEMTRATRDVTGETRSLNKGLCKNTQSCQSEPA